MVSERPTQYATIRIPLPLVNGIKEIINDPKIKKMGYLSHSEFIITTARNKYEELLRIKLKMEER